MTDFPHIKDDAAETADKLEKAIASLQRLYDLYQDEGNPEWGVDIEHADAKKLIESLKGIRGLLWHLGNNPAAAAALASQHADLVRREIVTATK